MTKILNDIPLLTFNSLYNLLREEKRTKKLQKLPELFYEALEKFLIEKKDEIKQLKKDNVDMQKLKKERYIFYNSKKISNELLNLRFMKISNITIKNKIFEDEILSEDNILEREKEFYVSVQKGVSKMLKLIQI
ncbi:MAG: hypothetical protein ACOC16_00985 [Nanoarchaeota archaeon]